MTIQEYQDLTGLTVLDADAPRIKAAIRRAETILGMKLGYSLSKQKRWTEAGRVRLNASNAFPSLPIGDELDLLPPAEQFGTIQLFNLDELDTYIRINPAKEIYRVSMVRPINQDEFVTVRDLEHSAPYLNDVGLVVAISRYHGWYSWPWWPSLTWRDRNDLMMAVDADYVNVCDSNKYPDLAYLLADMVTYYSDKDYSVMGNIRSESIDSHSYTRASTGKTPDEAAPEGRLSGKEIINRYAGASAFRKLVR